MTSADTKCVLANLVYPTCTSRSSIDGRLGGVGDGVATGVTAIDPLPEVAGDNTSVGKEGERGSARACGLVTGLTYKLGTGVVRLGVRCGERSLPPPAACLRSAACRPRCRSE